MPVWIETSWMYQRFGDQVKTRSSDSKSWKTGIWEENTWSPDYDALRSSLIKLQEYCNDNQFQIMSVLPLTEAHSYEFGQGEFVLWPGNASAGGWGVGQGWGVSQVVGFAALLQKVEDVSQEEFDRRTAEKKRQKDIERRNLEAKKLSADIETSIEEMRDLERDAADLRRKVGQPVTQKTGLLGGIKFIVDGRDFKSEAEAVDYRNQMAAKADALESSILTMKQNIEESRLKIKNLQAGPDAANTLDKP
ncbi:hypothetical protein [Paramagnetospirillum magneticum]|uniref:Uncharacterized protein n=1 Tax=Paramagnetospirillum magneticum (strain ATCC 700264 / AMB-1) TaxID=342108 RepID=Q2W0C3_PARM1|nr:hypothetical protein [Paramagnetospirillum magneticum]BAE52702.1 hypothetical protein amb3898 [Paramagnetospirillum magneticum AMB-1]